MNNDNVKDREIQPFGLNAVISVNRLLHELTVLYKLTPTLKNYGVPTKPLAVDLEKIDSDDFYIMNFIMRLTHCANYVLTTLKAKHGDAFNFTIECHKDTISNGKTFYEVSANFFGNTIQQYEYEYLDCLTVLVRAVRQNIEKGTFTS